MRRLLTMATALFLALGAQADDFNFFPSTDGWLWFNSTFRNEKYVGLINETDYKVDASDKAKIVQLVYADQAPDYPATVADPNIVGAGTDGETGSEGSTTGALVLQPTSGYGTVNGGGFVLKLPSCSKLTVDLSSNSKMQFRLCATTNPNAPMGNAPSPNYALDDANGWKIISAKYASPFITLGYGHKQVSLETLNNGSDKTTIQSDKPIYIWFQSATRDTLYIHGIYVATPKQETTGIKATANTSTVAPRIFTVDGRKVNATKVDDLQRGVYIVREQNKSRKVMVK